MSEPGQQTEMQTAAAGTGISPDIAAAPEMRAAPERDAHIPDCTYRLQLHAGFGFAQATALIPYLATLGVSHVYCSPYLRARPGSPHGYDIVDHSALNPELGTQTDFAAFEAALAAHGMGQVLDMVPNHMGVMGADNAWWLDLLENGPASPYASFFDVDWYPETLDLQGKIVLPVLGDHYGHVLQRGELRLEFDAGEGSFRVRYYDHVFPIDPREYPHIVDDEFAQWRERLGPDSEAMLDLESVCSGFAHLPPRSEQTEEAVRERARDKRFLQRRLAELCAQHPAVRELIEAEVRRANGEAANPAVGATDITPEIAAGSPAPDLGRFARLHALLEAQAYRLAYWRVASDEINYRRFFDINDLAGLRMNDPAVFEAAHRKVLGLVESGRLTGLRIDHPDGLYDPALYYRQLQSEIHGRGRNIYLVVEKILAGHERLPEDWPVHGTTGYDFLNQVNGLFIDPAAKEAMDRAYARFIGQTVDFDELLYQSKQRIMRTALASELHVLANRLNRISESDSRTRDFTLASLRQALSEVVACFPVYRTYITPDRVSEADVQHIDWAIAQAKRRTQMAETSIFDFLHEALLLRFGATQDMGAKQRLADFAMRFQQYSAPVTAKGMEDTAFYLYHRLIALNEVGGDPRRFGTTAAAWHYINQERVQRWPHTLLGTTTHDTKRSEDTRSRIDVLAELPAAWRRRALAWWRLNRTRRRLLDSGEAPSRNDEYLFYQTLVGALPLSENDDAGWNDFIERMAAYMLKAAREGKRHTSWVKPNPEYEEALQQFVRSTLDRSGRNLFLEDLLPFVRSLAPFGLLNSLAQCLIKHTAPGVPDVYQGNELWDFSLVDPDNRRPVDYARRERLLNELRAWPGSGTAPERLRALCRQPQDDRLKMLVTQRALALRREWREVFLRGDYLPLTTRGKCAEHVLAYGRRHGERTVVVAVPRLLYELARPSAEPDAGLLWPIDWGDTAVELDQSLADTCWTHVLSDATLEADAGALPVRDLFADCPLALLRLAAATH